MAAWVVFLLLAGGLAGYVVLYSDSVEVATETAPQDGAEQDSDGGEDPAVAASQPSLAIAGEQARPLADEMEAVRQSADTPAKEDNGSALPRSPSPSRELPQSGDAPTAENRVTETVEGEDRPSPDVMKQVAAREEPNRQDGSDTAAETQEPRPATQEGEPSPLPPQGDSADKTVAPQSTDTPAALPARTEEPAISEKAEGETQVAFRAPPPAPEPEEAPPWQRYSAYFLDEDTRPRVAIIMTGLGMSDGITEAAIKSLPAEVTLSFSPYARNLASWIGLARVNGHEVMLDLYMEPSTYPLDDPGPQAIMTVLSEEENRKRLNWVLSRGNSYVGLTGRLGSRLLTRQRSLSPVMQEIAKHGLVFVDDRATPGSLGYGMAQDLDIPAAYSEGVIDEPSANRTAIDAKLNRIERIALTKGAAVALAQPYPVTIERLNAWIEELSGRGVALAPVTAVVNRQPPVR